jgi:hypothetical protein
VVGFCEHGNAHLVSITCCEVLEQLDDWWRLKYTSPWILWPIVNCCLTVYFVSAINWTTLKLSTYYILLTLRLKSLTYDLP